MDTRQNQATSLLIIFVISQSGPQNLSLLLLLNTHHNPPSLYPQQHQLTYPVKMQFTLREARYAQSLLSSPQQDPPAVISTIRSLSLLPLPEGGFFIETDRDPLLIPNPFLNSTPSSTDPTDSEATSSNQNWSSTTLTSTTANNTNKPQNKSNNDPNTKVYNYAIASKATESPFRNASTSIHYLLTPSSPIGRFHRNKARTVHTLHWGRGGYVVLHPPGTQPNGSQSGRGVQEGTGKGKWTIETFVVGHDVARGEKLQWIVEGGRYKASCLLSDAVVDVGGSGTGTASGGGSEKGLFISETVVPGFEYTDHDFLSAEKLQGIVGEEAARELGWLLRNKEEN